jgi:NAD(P)-dependent dehydrogenase (short-subunit alcohol dehydrogenase family)
MQTILITGTSSGIGYSTAKEFTNRGYQVFGSVRTAADARRLEVEIGENFIPLVFDVTDGRSIQAALDLVTEIVGERGLGGLINNAGIATCGPLIYQPIEEIRWQSEVNVIAPIAVTQAFFPLLKIVQSPTNRPGRVINISSVAGKVAAPFMGAYAGSKHALEALSHSLRRELLLHDIDAIAIGPGPIVTPIWDKDSAQDLSRYDSTEYYSILETFQKYFLQVGKNGCPSAKVGEFIRIVFETKHPKTRYAIVPNPLINWYLPRFLPDRWLDRLIGDRFGIIRRSFK